MAKCITTAALKYLTFLTLAYLLPSFQTTLMKPGSKYSKIALVTFHCKLQTLPFRVAERC